MSTYLFTSESVSEGHPDKICDQISDAVLDALFSQDPMARVACECFAATGLLVVGGEITTDSYIDLPTVVRETIREIGYTKPEYRFDADSCAVVNVINKQSPDISMGVDTGGAGDQGIMFGYACSETPELMPAALMYSHKILQKLAYIRKHETNKMPYLRPDSKSQVTLKYSDTGEILGVDTVVVSVQHDPSIRQERIIEDVKNHAIFQTIPKELLSNETKFHINPTGKFEIGGPHGDTGLTGRKIIVDTYGGKAPHGGGAFSGKDPTKVDRSAAYAARHLAKNIVFSGLATECTIQLSYAIGVVDPVSIYVDTNRTGTIADVEISNFVIKNINLTPQGIIERFALRRPIYKQTASYGHFGRNEFPWEQINLVDLFKTI